MRLYGEEKVDLRNYIGVSYSFYVSGCKGYCKGCHSDHTHAFNQGTLMNEKWYETKLKEMKRYGDWKFGNIILLGGEPLDQPIEEVFEFFNEMKIAFPEKKLGLYTHFEIEEIDPVLLIICDFIKTGKFDIDNLDIDYKSNGVSLASNNQKMLLKGIDY
jgi:organic radical activating enzyme